jgi:DNA topoisomerase-3
VESDWNEQERKIIQGVGIGTPATRAAIIETLLKGICQTR